MDWRTIDTMDVKPGVASDPVLLYCPDITTWARYSNASPIVIGAWDGQCWESDLGEVEPGYGEAADFFVREVLSPTHWIPLPAEPKPDARKAPLTSRTAVPAEG